MSVLLRVSELLGSPLGSFVYHLLLLLAIEAALGMAWGEWQRTRRERARRLLLAMGGLTLVRVVYIVPALAATGGWETLTWYLPPLERFADTASIALLGWGFTPPAKRGTGTWDLVFGANLLLAVGVCIAFVVMWGQALSVAPSLDYNASWQATVWTVWQVGLVPLAALAVARSRVDGWGIFLMAMLFIFLGLLLQAAYPLPLPNLPIWERLANMIAYPLIAVAVYQSVITGMRVQIGHLEDISQASLDQIKSLLFLIEAGRKVAGSLNPVTVLDNAVSTVARALEADQCAVALPDQDDTGQMRLAAVHNPTRQGRAEAVTFPVEYQLTIQQAMRRKKRIAVEELDNVQLKVLFGLMGSSETGPLLVQPLLLDGEAIGAILVGNSRSLRPFTSHEAKLCQSMAEQVAGAIENARRYQALELRYRELYKLLGEGSSAPQEQPTAEGVAQAPEQDGQSRAEQPDGQTSGESEGDVVARSKDLSETAGEFAKPHVTTGG
ncbi:GAF domain-containing protein [Chloroflexota bacterium]